MHRLVWILLSCVAGCGGGGAERVCEPGKTETCACVGDGQGAQTCEADGASWGECICPNGTEGTASSTTGASSGSTGTDTTDVTSGTGSGVTTGTDSGTGGGSSTGGPACDDGTLGGPNTPECDACVACSQMSECAQQWEACAADTPCDAFVKCVNACYSNCGQDPDCESTCIGTGQCGNSLPGSCLQDLASGCMDYDLAIECTLCTACVDNCDQTATCG